MGKKSKGSMSATNGGPAKKGKTSLEFQLNPDVLSEDNIKEMKDRWSNRWSINEKEKKEEEFRNKNLLFINKPFPCCQIRDLIVNNQGELDHLTSELSLLDYNEKNNDLYKFAQSADLNNDEFLSYPSISAFKKFIYGPLLSWMKDVSGIELNEGHIDLFAAQYGNSDYLLCHDDELEGRRLAFIWYLVPADWSEDDGGALDLFDIGEETGEPNKVVKSLVPVRNAFNFFEVSHLSFHQVAEVLAKDKTRLSITGWFRGSSLPGPPKAPSLPLEKLPPLDIMEDDFHYWINPSFLSPETQGDIQETFEEKSEISLSNFLLPERFSAIKESLLESSLSWKALGPPNRRCYDVLEGESVPTLVGKLLKFLRSDAFFLFLSNVTGIKLHPLFEGDEEEAGEGSGAGTFSPRCSSECRRWKAGSYTLIRDTDKREVSLDARLCFNVPGGDWDDSKGGFTSYIAKDEDDELMSVSPEDNTLLLVYKDEETLKFVKYLNHNFGPSYFYDIEMSYFEEP